MESSEIDSASGSVFDRRNYFLPEQIVELRAAQIKGKRERSSEQKKPDDSGQQQASPTVLREGLFLFALGWSRRYLPPPGLGELS